MAQMVPNYQERQEFWKPVVSPRAEAKKAETEQICPHCGTDFVLGSRFCHICGADRHDHPTGTSASREWFEFAAIRDMLGQSNASLIAFLMGTACLIAAVVTGFLFTANTVLDWQAVQVWRMEWLLGATALFGAGILLKKSR